MRDGAARAGAARPGPGSRSATSAASRRRRLDGRGARPQRRRRGGRGRSTAPGQRGRGAPRGHEPALVDGRGRTALVGSAGATLGLGGLSTLPPHEDARRRPTTSGPRPWDMRVSVLFLGPTGLADGLAQKECATPGGGRGDSPPKQWVPRSPPDGGDSAEMARHRSNAKSLHMWPYYGNCGEDRRLRVGWNCGASTTSRWPGPPGCEPAARSFYGGLLGLREIPKPPLRWPRDGGVWFQLGDQELHIGIEPRLPARAQGAPGVSVRGPRRAGRRARRTPAGPGHVGRRRCRACGASSRRDAVRQPPRARGGGAVGAPASGRRPRRRRPRRPGRPGRRAARRASGPGPARGRSRSRLMNVTRF